MPYYPPGKDMAWDLQDFHPACPAPQVIAHPSYIVLYCSACRCLMHLDIVARTTSAAAGRQARPLA